MGVIAQYEVSATNPSTVGGVGTVLKYFPSAPASSVWNGGQIGVNQRVDSAQISGATPSATNASGQLSPIIGGKFGGGRFRVYMSGSTLSATNPLAYPSLLINTAPVSNPSYTTLFGLGGTAIAVTPNKPQGWSVSAQFFFDPNNGLLHGWLYDFLFVNVPGGSADQGSSWSAPAGPITPVKNLSVTAVSGGGSSGQGTTGQPGFGFVVGFTFNVSDPSNTASLYEFKIVQD